MSLDNNGSFKCKCNDYFISEEALRQHIKERIDATDWKTHGIMDKLEV